MRRDDEHNWKQFLELLQSGESEITQCLTEDGVKTIKAAAREIHKLSDRVKNLELINSDLRDGQQERSDRIKWLENMVDDQQLTIYEYEIFIEHGEYA